MQSWLPLRGAAALAVAWHHVTDFERVAVAGSALQRSGSYGGLGIDVFFVISGFIIPLTLDRSGYQLRDYGRFVLKRVLRIDPPYLTAIALMLIAWRASGWLGLPAINPNPVTRIQLLLHLGYLPSYFGYPWILGAAWTLAIEFQYYVCAGLIFPLMQNSKRFWLVIAPILAVLSLAATSGQTIVAWVPLFLAGIAAFHLYTTRIRRAEFFFILGVLSVQVAFLMGVPEAIVTAATACAIVFGKEGPKPLVWLGIISYPLYLMYGIFGRASLYILNRYLPFVPLWLLTFISLGVAIGAAVIMHVLVEQAAQRWSKSVSYRRPARGNGPTRIALQDPGSPAGKGASFIL